MHLITSAGTLRLAFLSMTLVAPTLAAGGLPQSPAVRVTPGPPQPTTWVAFAAELRIEHPDRPTAFGRFLQDEHGCSRRETVHPDGSLMVSIMNFQDETFYQLMRGNWTSQPMRLVPGIPRRAPVRNLNQKTTPIEGYEAFISVMEVKSPRGNYTRESVVLPALNNFEAVSKQGNGETITAQNIRPGTPDHAEFMPPPGAAVGVREGFGGAMTFQGLTLRLTFAANGQTSVTEASEEGPTLIKTPGGDQFFILARAREDRTDVLRVQVMRNAQKRGLGRVEGDIIEEIEFPFTGVGTTTKLAENFSVVLMRIGARKFR
jgi:hypothetical protein